MKLGALISGGKDGWYSSYMAKRNNDLVCLINLKSENPDSFMFHTPNSEFVENQAKAAGLPLVSWPTSGIKEEELKDLKAAIKLAKDKYKIEGLVSGALHSEYQRSRIAAICDELGLKSVTPLWHMSEEVYMQNFLVDEWEVIIIGIAGEGFDEEWLGRKIDRHALTELKKLKEKFGIHLAGEGGEYESFVLNCPLLKHKLRVADSDSFMDSKNSGKLIIKGMI